MLVQLRVSGTGFTEASKSMYASNFLTGTTTVWWYTLEQRNSVPTTWEQLKKKLRSEFFLNDTVRRPRDRLQKLRQTSSVSKYLCEFHNFILEIPGMNDEERWDRFCAGRKYELRF